MNYDNDLEIISSDEEFIWDLDDDDIEDILNDDSDNYYDNVSYFKESYEYDIYLKNKEKQKNIKTAGAVFAGGAISGGIGYIFGITAGIICTLSTVTGSAVIYKTG